MRCYQRLLTFPIKDHVTTDEVRRRIPATVDEYDECLTLVKENRGVSNLKE